MYSLIRMCMFKADKIIAVFTDCNTRLLAKLFIPIVGIVSFIY